MLLSSQMSGGKEGEMPEHRIIFTYVAEDEGSRKRPFIIINEGGFGRIHKVSRIFEDRPFYEITMFSEGDPEEVLANLRRSSDGGVFVLLMEADGHEIFKHNKYHLINSPKKSRKKK